MSKTEQANKAGDEVARAAAEFGSAAVLICADLLDFTEDDAQAMVEAANRIAQGAVEAARVEIAALLKARGK